MGPKSVYFVDMALGILWLKLRSEIPVLDSLLIQCTTGHGPRSVQQKPCSAPLEPLKPQFQGSRVSSQSLELLRHSTPHETSYNP